MIFKKSHIILTIMLGIFMPGIVCSCGSDDDNIILGGPGGNNDSDIAEYSRRIEVPALRNGKGIYFVVHEANATNNNTTDKIVNYCLEYDSSAYHSRWVAFCFDATSSEKNVSRSDEPFAEDPKLPYTCRLGSRAFSGHYEYNRGHLCASADRLNSTEANQQTFYMSNMSPQLATFNQGYWVTLEGLLQKWARNGGFDKIYVTKGGTIMAGQRKSDSPLKTTNMLGKTANVVIPQYYFMAILAEKNNSYQAIGFWMEHKEYGYSNQNKAPISVIKKHAMSIDELEDLTGIDFFCNLNDVVERNVERTYLESAWTWR